MSTCAPALTFTHFADDTTVSCCHPDIKTLINVANEGSSQIDVWLRSNRLSLNVRKSHYMLFSNNKCDQIEDIRIRGVEIEKVELIKFLGIHIDNKLSFSDHI